MTIRSIEHLVTKHRWKAPISGVYVPAWVPPSRDQELMMAHLWAGAGSCVSHRAAGFKWELDGVEWDAPEVTTPKRMRHPSVIAHYCGRLACDHVTTKDGFVITNPTRTIVDLAACLKPVPFEAALDSALRRRLTHMELLEEMLEGFGRGRRGVAKLRTLLADRRAGVRLVESYLEVDIYSVLCAAGLPPPARQHSVMHRGRVVARLDFAWPEIKVGIEGHSRRWHSSLEAWEKDSDRLALLVSLGWRILPATSRQTKRGAGELVARVRRLLAEVESARDPQDPHEM